MAEKKLGILVLIWLSLILIDNALTTYLLSVGYFTSRFPTIPKVAILVLQTATITNIVCAIYIFLWKRWAFYLYCGVAVVTFTIKLLIGQGIVMAAVGLIFPVILYLLLRPKWDLFK